MKKLGSAWSIVVLCAIVLLSVHPTHATASSSSLINMKNFSLHQPQTAETPSPSETAEVRVLPAVGSNAGLVLGAAVLVLIIIGGVIISARWRSKH